MPWGEPVENLPEELFEALPRPIERSMMNMDSMMSDGGMDTDGMMSSSPNSDMIAPGRWLGCGSCNTCGHPTNECVTSPEGACLWDPATCRGAGAWVTDMGRSMYNPVRIDCSANQPSFVSLAYNDPASTYSLYSGSATGASASGTCTGASLDVSYICPNVGVTETITINAADDGGAVFNFSFTVKGN